MAGWGGALAGTDPQNGVDLLKADSVTRVGNELVVRFRTVAGRIYQIQESPSLAADSWRILVPMKQAVSHELEVVVPVTAGRGFYRALLLE